MLLQMTPACTLLKMSRIPVIMPSPPKVPMLEPSDSAECCSFTKLAYSLSEEYDTPVIIRLSTRISHSCSIVDTQDRKEIDLKPYEKQPSKYVVLPAFARAKHPLVEERTKKLSQWAENCDINRIENNNAKIGVIVSGAAYQYAKEALGDTVSYLKLGMVHPLPVDLIRNFANMVETVYVIEELDPIIETHCNRIGVPVIGKELFPICGELSQKLIKKLMLHQEDEVLSLDEPTPVRPPVMCCGCPPQRSLL